MRAILNDPSKEKELQNNGYVVIPNYLSQIEVDDLNDYYLSLALAPPAGFHVSNYNTDVALKKNISNKIAEVIGTKANIYLNNYKPLTGLFYIKEADEAEDFYIHLDWNMVNEAKFQSIAIWVPLVDINDKNGGIALLKGSQHEPLRWRGNPGFCYPSYNADELKQKYEVVRPRLKAGDAVLWTHKLFHGSAQNISGSRRIAASQILIPSESQPILINTNGAGEYELYNTSSDFFAELEPGQSPPLKYLKAKFPTLNSLISSNF